MSAKRSTEFESEAEIHGRKIHPAECSSREPDLAALGPEGGFESSLTNPLS